jgi:hypothetical protein
MKWTELITIRSTECSVKTLTLALRELISDVVREYGAKRIQIYHRQKIDSDFCIILSHEGKPVLNHGSRLGLRIAEALRAFGMVNHSVWSEMK